MDEAKKLATRLIAQVRKLRNKGTNTSSRHVDALERLSRIFKGETESLPTDTPYLEPTSVTPTAPTAIRQTPRVHLRQTRRNTPGRLPVIPTTISEGGRQTTEGESATSEGERQSTEGEQAASEGEYTSSQEWYNTPRQTTRPKPTSHRRSERIRRKVKAIATVAQQEPIIPQQQSPDTVADTVIFEEPATPYEPPPRTKSPRIISQEALYSFIANATDDRRTRYAHFTPQHLQLPAWAKEHDLAEFCAPVIHPTTGAIITKYHKLAKDKELGYTWQTSFGKEFGSLAQGDKRTGTKGNSTLVVMDRKDIPNIPSDRTVTYPVFAKRCAIYA